MSEISAQSDKAVTSTTTQSPNPGPGQTRQSATSGSLGSGQLPPNSQSNTATEVSHPITLQEVSKTVDTIKELVQNLDRDLEFRVDEITGKTVVTVLNKQTQEVVRQIPNEALLSLAQRLKMGGGLLDDLIG